MMMPRLLPPALLALIAACRAPGSEPLFIRGEEVPLSAPVSWVAIDDLNGDGRIDAAAALPTGLVSVLLGIPGGLGPPADYPAGLSPVFVTTGRIDGDAFPDLLVVESGSSTVSVLFNRGDGTFRDAASSRVSVGASPRMALLADLDGDGDLDVVTTNFGSMDLSVLLGDGKGSFQAAPRIPVRDNPHSLAEGDFDGDGRVDVATANRNSWSLTFLRNLTGPGSAERFRRGDADSSGKVDLTDAVALLGSLFLGEGPVSCPDGADADDSGVLDISDAVGILLHLFQGGGPLPAPGSGICGEDPTPDGLLSCRDGCPAARR
jgi:hypothetical protein